MTLVLSLVLGLTPVRAAMAAPLCAASSAGGAFGTGGHGAPGYLGIDVRDVSEETVSALKLRGTHGAEIIRVDHDGPAGKMGLREHDIVLQVNGQNVDDEEQLRRVLREMSPGRQVTLVIFRDAHQLTATGTMADQAEVEREAWELHLSPAAQPGQPGGPQAPSTGLPSGDAGMATGSVVPGASSTAMPQTRYGKSFLGTFLTSPTYTGVVLEAMGPQLAQFFAIPGGAGLLVQGVDANSPAAMAGMRAGDVVVRANQQPVGNLSHWTKMIREAKGRPVLVTVMRDHQERTFTLVPDTKKRSRLDGFPYTAPGSQAEPVRTTVTAYDLIPTGLM